MKVLFAVASLLTGMVLGVTLTADGTPVTVDTGTPIDRAETCLGAPMSELYQLTIHATGEVRDAEGNLISSEPVEATMTVTADQLRAIKGESE